MSKILYYLGIFFYRLVIQLAAFFKNEKAQQWIEGRKGIFERLEQAFAQNQQPVIWIHCASLGEFEQGRPLIEALKLQTPQYKILLTFFSPSGYEIRKNYPQADYVFYLPADSPQNATKFIAIVKPQQVFFVKYEFWYYYLSTLQQQQIPTFLISAIFRPKQVFFKWYGGIFREMLFCFDYIFVQNQTSVQLLNNLNYQKVVLAGDTRLDRVIAIKNQMQFFPIVDVFSKSHYTLVCGSTWLEDETLLADFLQQFPNCKLVIAPHEIQESHLKQIEEKFHFTNSLRYSQQPNNEELSKASVLIIDNIGMLSSLYSHANLAYIGGGFGLGIHNSLEAAVFEIPILFGGNYHKFQEAKDLIEQGVAFEVKKTEDILQIVQQLQESSAALIVQKKAQHYFQQNSGATKIILDHVYQT